MSDSTETAKRYKATRLKSEEVDAVFPLLELGYYGRPSKASKDKWSWQYERNPMREGAGFDTWIVKDGDTIIAQRPTMPTSLKVGDAYHHANYLTDFLVHPDYRDQGLGTLLQRGTVGGVDICVSLDASMRSRTIFGKLGFTWLGEVPRFVRVCDPAPYVADRLGNWTQGVAPLLRAGWNWKHRGDREPATGLEIEPVTEFGTDFDALWERISPHYPVIARRDSASLNWRYVAAPAETSILVARRGGEIAGYVVYRVLESGNRKRGFICDLLVSPDDNDSLLALIRRVIMCLREQDVQAVDTYAHHPVVQSGLRRLGFVEKPGVSFIVNTTLPEPAGSLMADRGNWYITGLDSDLDPIFR